MEWLKAHEFLAAWLSLPMMVIVTIFQGVKGEGKPVGIARMTLYFGFLTSLAATLTTTIDTDTRVFSGAMSFFLAIGVLIHAWVELKAAHPEEAEKLKAQLD